MAPPIELPAWTTRPAIVAVSRSILVSPPSRPNTIGVALIRREHDRGMREIAEALDAAERLRGRWSRRSAPSPSRARSTRPRSPVPRSPSASPVAGIASNNSAASHRASDHHGRFPCLSRSAIQRASSSDEQRTPWRHRRARDAVENDVDELVAVPWPELLGGQRLAEPALQGQPVAGAAILPHQIRQLDRIGRGLSGRGRRHRRDQRQRRVRPQPRSRRSPLHRRAHCAAWRSLRPDR